MPPKKRPSKVSDVVATDEQDATPSFVDAGATPPPVPRKRAPRKKKAETETETETETENKNESKTENETENKNDRKGKGKGKGKGKKGDGNVENSEPSIAEDATTVQNAWATGFVPRTNDSMERVKSRIEMFGKSEHTALMRSIIIKYGTMMAGDGTPGSNTRRALDSFGNQVTQNNNGVFLNLTSCSDDLWQACAQCIEQMDMQQVIIEKLDKERQNEIRRLQTAVVA